jgi:hypothetical protein
MGINGNLGRSKTMRSPDPITGKFDVSPSFYIKDAQQINVDTIRNKYLTPAPVVWPVGTPKKSVMHVACGAMHMLVVARTTGQFASMVYACGMNANGQLGIRNDVLTKEVEEVHELTPVRLTLLIGYQMNTPIIYSRPFSSFSTDPGAQRQVYCQSCCRKVPFFSSRLFWH